MVEVSYILTLCFLLTTILENWQLRVILFLIAIFAWLMGVMFWTNSASAIHEIAALVTILIGSVFFVGAAIVDAIVNASKNLDAKNS